MDPSKVLKICNVAFTLLKFVIFYGNKPTCSARGFF